MTPTSYRFPRGTLVRVDRGNLSQMRKIAVVLGDSRTPGKYRIAVWSDSAQAWSRPQTATVDARGRRQILGHARTGNGDKAFDRIVARASENIRALGMPDERKTP